MISFLFLIFFFRKITDLLLKPLLSLPRWYKNKNKSKSKSKNKREKENKNKRNLLNTITQEMMKNLFVCIVCVGVCVWKLIFFSPPFLSPFSLRSLGTLILCFLSLGLPLLAVLRMSKTARILFIRFPHKDTSPHKQKLTQLSFSPCFSLPSSLPSDCINALPYNSHHFWVVRPIISTHDGLEKGGNYYYCHFE